MKNVVKASAQGPVREREHPCKTLLRDWKYFNEDVIKWTDSTARGADRAARRITFCFAPSRLVIIRTLRGLVQLCRSGRLSASRFSRTAK